MAAYRSYLSLTYQLNEALLQGGLIISLLIDV
jgi:hypothetical protein